MFKVKISSALSITTEELTSFVFEAKQKGYASGQKPLFNSVTKVKSLNYREGQWLYIDEFRGSFMAPGTETVYYFMEENEPPIPVWQMYYAGGMIEPFWFNREVAQKTYAVLKESLKFAPPTEPFRGPHRIGFSKHGSYEANWDGHIGLFQGSEKVTVNLDNLDNFDFLKPDFNFIQPYKLTFKQNFGGSIIVYKD